jgi:hypothetical protein
MHAPCCFKNLKGMMVERLQACEEAGHSPGTLEQGIWSRVPRQKAATR